MSGSRHKGEDGPGNSVTSVKGRSDTHSPQLGVRRGVEIGVAKTLPTMEPSAPLCAIHVLTERFVPLIMDGSGE